MAKTRTQRIPEWTGNSQRDVGATELPRADDFGYDDEDLGYHGAADPGVWHADSWPMCTRGNPQRLRHPVAYSVDRDHFHQIELHVPVSGGERSCNAICQEDRECVRVRVFVCCTAHDWDSFTIAANDESWEKLRFYAAHHVDEVLIIEPDNRAIHWLGLCDDSFAPIERSTVIDLGPADLASVLGWG